MRLKRKINKFKLALAVTGVCGAAFFLTVPVGVVSFLLYFFLASLVIPFVWDLL
jgi:hypothetical protein|tara:strand:+ start:611 stop:772 length:162 start_codon:yes stop_codon:yes gene_type:complete